MPFIAEKWRGGISTAGHLALAKSVWIGVGLHDAHSADVKIAVKEAFASSLEAFSLCCAQRLPACHVPFGWLCHADGSSFCAALFDSSSLNEQDERKASSRYVSNAN
eukprot:807338-Pleurochrysis_carterae.AAC.8